jgi:hypothetical protein
LKWCVPPSNCIFQFFDAVLNSSHLILQAAAVLCHQPF